MLKMCEHLYPFSYRLYVVMLIGAEGLFYCHSALQFLKNGNEKGDTPVFHQIPQLRKCLPLNSGLNPLFQCVLMEYYQVSY